MPAPSPEPMTKVTFRVYERDYALLKVHFHDRDLNAALRDLIAAYAERVRRLRR